MDRLGEWDTYFNSCFSSWEAEVATATYTVLSLAHRASSKAGSKATQRNPGQHLLGDLSIFEWWQLGKNYVKYVDSKNICVGYL